MNQNLLKVVVCICTYQRPDGLKKLLQHLAQQTLQAEITVVVADNHSAHEGIAVCNEISPDYPFPITTLSADEPGISAARNAATSSALKQNPDLIAFLDDDEWPEPQWLSELIQVQNVCNADVVGGPTKPEFPPHTPQELLSNPYYGADMGLPDKSSCVLQAGGNFLIKSDVIRTMAPNFFHPDFSYSGGEDLAFFTQLHLRGFVMFWAANAVVHEPVPDSRLQAGWLKHRIVNIHNSRVRVMQMLEPEIKASFIRGCKTMALGIVAGSLSAVSLLLPSLKEKAALLRWKFLGKCTAHFGRMTVRGEQH